MNVIKYLKNANAKFYGIDGCGYCADQKKEIGSENMKSLYIDCGNSKNKMCSKLDGFPTWEINGKFYPGYHTLSELNSKIPSKFKK